MVVSEGVPVPLTRSCLLLLPDKQSSSASLETLLALLQAEGAKIEEDTEVNPASPAGRPRAVTRAWAQLPQGQACRLRGEGGPASGLGRAPAWGPGEQRGQSGPQVRGARYTESAPVPWVPLAELPSVCVSWPGTACGHSQLSTRGLSLAER